MNTQRKYKLELIFYIYIYSTVRGDKRVSNTLSKVIDIAKSDFWFHQKCLDYYTHSTTLANIEKAKKADQDDDNDDDKDKAIKLRTYQEREIETVRLLFYPRGIICL